MNDRDQDGGSVGGLLRHNPDGFDALRDRTAEIFNVDPGAIEKDYWATEVLRCAAAPLTDVDCFVFKGGTSLSKAYGIIQRFSEDVDLLVITALIGNPLKRLLRSVADRVTAELELGYEREQEGRGYLNARYGYTPRREVGFLTPGVLLEMGSRGGPLPNEARTIASLMSSTATEVDSPAVSEYSDLAPFEVTVLAPERTLAEKLSFLHHRATTGDHKALARGARHLYDAAMLLGSERVRDALVDGRIVELMVDIDQRSEAAGWPYTPRPDGGFATSQAFVGNEHAAAALRDGYSRLEALVWGTLPDFDEAIATITRNAHLI